MTTSLRASNVPNVDSYTTPAAVENTDLFIEEDEDSDIIISYEYDDDSIEFLESLENSAFFS